VREVKTFAAHCTPNNLHEHPADTGCGMFFYGSFTLEFPKHKDEKYPPVFAQGELEIATTKAIA
jgi:hypothetical protein